MTRNHMMEEWILAGHYFPAFLSFIDMLARQVKDDWFGIPNLALSDEYTIKERPLNGINKALENNLKNSLNRTANKSKQNKKILLIEDDPIIQHIHKEMLLKMHCDVDVVGDCITAMNLLEIKYDLIFLDIGLPGMSGIEFINHIRDGATQNKYTKIYMLTAITDPKVKQECLDIGANQVLSKPISFEDLYAKVLRIDHD